MSAGYKYVSKSCVNVQSLLVKFVLSFNNNSITRSALPLMYYILPKPAVKLWQKRLTSNNQCQSITSVFLLYFLYSKYSSPPSFLVFPVFLQYSQYFIPVFPVFLLQRISVEHQWVSAQLQIGPGDKISMMNLSIIQNIHSLK